MDVSFDSELSVLGLNDEQRRLVQDNIGLVAVHLRRHVPNLARPRHDREWEDLFQEGCLGLMRAAAAFEPRRGIAFQPFALARIHNAVSRALHTKFSNLYVPPPRVRRSRGSVEPRDGREGAPVEVDAEANRDSRRGRSGSKCRKDRLRTDPNEAPLIDAPREGSRKRPVRRGDIESSPCAPEAPPRREAVEGDTLRRRLGEKYDRAVRGAVRLLSGQRSLRGDRRELVEVLANERYLVPVDECKRPLRRIARETRSSYARVAQCDAQFAQAVRHQLESDPEFRELDRLRREHPEGIDLPIDPRIEETLAERCEEEFVKRFRSADPAGRSAMLREALECSGEDVEALIRGRIQRLSPEMRERVLGAALATSSEEGFS